MWHVPHALVNVPIALVNASASLSSAAFAMALDCSAYCFVSFSHESASPFGALVLGRLAQHSVSVLASFCASSHFMSFPAALHLAQRPFSVLVPATAFMISLIDGVFSSAAAAPSTNTRATVPANIS